MTKKATMLADIKPGDVIRGTVHACACCGQWFIARADALYCSTACRVRAKRKEEKTGC